MNPRLVAEETEASVPADFRQALAAAPAAKAKWNDLTPISRRDFISWLDSAKQARTRNGRIEKACSMLAAGKRRPCCYSIVSFDLYTALKAAPSAKARWSVLTPVERRDFIGWMDAAKEPEAHRLRIKQACSMLAAGQRWPSAESDFQKVEPLFDAVRTPDLGVRQRQRKRRLRTLPLKPACPRNAKNDSRG